MKFKNFPIKIFSAGPGEEDFSNSKKQLLQLMLLIGFVSIPGLVHIYQMISEKGLVVSSFYLLFHISFLLLPLVVIRPFYWGISLIPFLFLVPSEFIHVYHYDGYSTLSAFISSIETDPAEFKEFLYNYRIYFFIAIPISLTLIVFHFLIIKPSLKLHRSLKLSIVGLFIFAIFSFGAKTVYDLSARGQSWGESLSGLNEVYSRLFNQNFPYAYILKIHDYAEQRILYEQSIAHKKGFSFGAAAPKEYLNDHAPVHVIVIGETARAHNWSLNGYPRNTNPQLSDRSGLYYCDDAIAAATHTRESIMLTLTRATPKNTQPIYNEKSLITAFSEAGYKTFWLSTQNMTGGVDSQVYVLASEADEDAYIGGDYEFNTTYDEELIPELRHVLDNNKNSPLFIIIHTLGSHERYRMRYTPAFDHFQPSSEGDDYNWNSPGIRERLLNSYDNSILYTDYVLDSMIELLAETGRASSFLYFSDHGENILDDGSDRFGHGGVIPTKYVTDIPFFFWFSDQYRNLETEIVGNISEHCKKPISTDNVFDTLLDLGKVEISNHRTTKSLGNKNFENTERYILNTSFEPIKYSNLEQ